MPGLDTAAIKTSITGTINGSQDWSVNFWMKGLLDPLVLDMAGVAGAVKDLVHTWATAVSAYWTSDTKCTGVKCYEYPIGTTHSLHEDTVLFDAPVSGGGSGAKLPTFCALVNTLRTAVSGRSYRGRMYVPITSMSLGNDGQAGVLETTNLATATRDLLAGCNALDLSADGVTGQKVVVASFTKGLTTPVVSVTVDTLMDVQHRREDKIGAAYQALEYL